MSWRPDQHLYPYQESACRVMTDRNTLVAYDMGLGKTPMALAAIEELFAAGEINQPGLVLAPASLLSQWARQIHRFTDSGWLLLAGSPEFRSGVYADAVADGGPRYLVMSYATFVNDVEARRLPLAELRGFVICDEATAIKSFRSKRSRTVKSYLRNVPVKIALTGTPMVNGKLEELYSVLEWVQPELLGSFADFEARYIRRNPMGWIEGYRNLDRLRTQVSGHVLRKRADDPAVRRYLPTVHQLEPIEVALSRTARRSYDAIVADILSDLDEMVATMRSGYNPAEVGTFFDTDDEDDHPDGRLMAKIQAARMLLDHPEAVIESGLRYALDQTTGSAYAHWLVAEGIVDGNIRPDKLTALYSYLADAFDGPLPAGSKAVVFTSFLQPAAAIAAALADYRPVTFTGAMSTPARDVALQVFATHPDCRVMVSTDAGGMGLDLPAANLLINYDLPWQAGLLDQRNARIRRASTQWPSVSVVNMVTLGTLEERMVAMQAHKAAVSESVLDGRHLDDAGNLLSDLESLRGFLVGNSGSSS